MKTVSLLYVAGQPVAAFRTRTEARRYAATQAHYSGVTLNDRPVWTRIGRLVAADGRPTMFRVSSVPLL